MRPAGANDANSMPINSNGCVNVSRKVHRPNPISVCFTAKIFNGSSRNSLGGYHLHFIYKLLHRLGYRLFTATEFD